MARLLVRAGAEPGKEYALPESGELKIGRLPMLPIALLDTKVSREHCRVYRQSTGWVVEDLGSRNGTYMGKRRLEGRITLGEREPFRIGNTYLLFVRDDAQARDHFAFCPEGHPGDPKAKFCGACGAPAA